MDVETLQNTKRKDMFNSFMEGAFFSTEIAGCIIKLISVLR
jgi:hypothetical protein